MLNKVDVNGFLVSISRGGVFMFLFQDCLHFKNKN